MSLAQDLGIVINLEKSSLVPSQVIEYLVMSIDTERFWVFPTEKQARSWQSLLGHLSSLEKFVPGSRLSMRPLQYHLIRTWNRVSQ